MLYVCIVNCNIIIVIYILNILLLYKRFASMPTSFLSLKGVILTYILMCIVLYSDIIEYIIFFLNVPVVSKIRVSLPT